MSPVTFSLNDHNDVPMCHDESIRDYVDRNFKYQACHGNINGKSYASEYECEICTNYDFDIKETLFGGIKETNKRYCYDLNLYIFESSADMVAIECHKALRSSDFLAAFFENIKKSFVSELKRVAKI